VNDDVVVRSEFVDAALFAASGVKLGVTSEGGATP
jgi:hypothetical protein